MEFGPSHVAAVASLPCDAWTFESLSASFPRYFGWSAATYPHFRYRHEPGDPASLPNRSCGRGVFHVYAQEVVGALSVLCATVLPLGLARCAVVDYDKLSEDEMV